MLVLDAAPQPLAHPAHEMAHLQALRLWSRLGKQESDPAFSVGMVYLMRQYFLVSTAKGTYKQTVVAWLAKSEGIEKSFGWVASTPWRRLLQQSAV